MSEAAVNKDGALVVDMAQADALWNSLDPIKRAELTNMMFEPVLAKAKQQADRIEELEAKLAKAVKALERLSTAELHGDGEAWGLRLSESAMGREILARMKFARTTITELKGGKDE